jgi:hypothetical protein
MFGQIFLVPRLISSWAFISLRLTSSYDMRRPDVLSARNRADFVKARNDATRSD